MYCTLCTQAVAVVAGGAELLLLLIRLHGDRGLPPPLLRGEQVRPREPCDHVTACGQVQVDGGGAVLVPAGAARAVLGRPLAPHPRPGAPPRPRGHHHRLPGRLHHLARQEEWR